MPPDPMAPDLPSLHERADSLADLAHYGQVDKSKRPYIEHPRMVAAYAVEMVGDFERWREQVLDPVRAATTALLHDTVEDTWVTPSVLRALFPDWICTDVLTLTQIGRGSGSRQAYRQAILNSRTPYPLLVKAADLRHNTDMERMLRLDPDDRTGLARKYTDDVAALGLDKSPFAAYFYHLDDFLQEHPHEHS